jgi:hypothetical protein
MPSRTLLSPVTSLYKDRTERSIFLVAWTKAKSEVDSARATRLVAETDARIDTGSMTRLGFWLQLNTRDASAENDEVVASVGDRAERWRGSKSLITNHERGAKEDILLVKFNSAVPFAGVAPTSQGLKLLGIPSRGNSFVPLWLL